MTPLADAALAAVAARKAAAEQAEKDKTLALQDDARAVLLATFGAAPGLSALTVEHVDADNKAVVFSDTVVWLFVYADPAVVWSVTRVDGKWQQGVVLASLADLGALLEAAGVQPSPPAPVVAAWAAGQAVKVGDLRTFEGKTYRCIQAHSTQAGWSPPVVPALWVVA